MSLAPLLNASFAVQIHIVAALAALGLGTSLMVLRKGTGRHRLAGRLWMALMLVVAMSSFWITGLNGARWSWIHGLSIFTLVSLAGGLWFVRTGRIRHHRFTMIGVFAAGLIGAGAGALLPGRLISRIFDYG